MTTVRTVYVRGNAQRGGYYQELTEDAEARTVRCAALSRLHCGHLPQEKK